MVQRITKTISPSHFLFGNITWFEKQVKITWEGESFHSYDGCPGRQFFDSTYGRVEYFTATKKGCTLPDGYKIEA